MNNSLTKSSSGIPGGDDEDNGLTKSNSSMQSGDDHVGRHSNNSSSSSSGEVLPFMVLGKAGNGKSSLCNAVLGEERFAVGRGLTTTTRTVQSETMVRGHRRVQVVDTPDIRNCGMDAQRQKEEVDKWKPLFYPLLTVVLLAVRCDVRYTAEEFAIYREIMTLWGDNSLKKRLVVAFTFGDRQDNDLEDELGTVCPELKSVLRDADNRYVLFDKTSEQSRSRIVSDIQKAMVKKGASGAGRGTSQYPPRDTKWRVAVFAIIGFSAAFVILLITLIVLLVDG